MRHKASGEPRTVITDLDDFLMFVESFIHVAKREPGWDFTLQLDRANEPITFRVGTIRRLDRTKLGERTFTVPVAIQSVLDGINELAKEASTR